jgi:hypothetical protein
MAVTVITTAGTTTYTVANGASWEEEITPTGELAVTVFDAGTPAARLASFGSVETAYLNSEVAVTLTAAARGRL